jgi:hypothetical protein
MDDDQRIAVDTTADRAWTQSQIKSLCASDMTVLPVGQSRCLSRFSGSFSHSRYSRGRAELHTSVLAFGFESEEELLESEDRRLTGGVRTRAGG